MKMVKTGSMIAVLLVSMLSSPSWGQDQRGVWESIEIQVLMAKIGVMDGSRVQVIGHVVQVSLADAARADRYLLEGYKGGTVAVQFTTERPLPTTHVFVQGVVNIDGGGNGYIAEVRRFALDPSKVTPLIQDSVLAAIDTIAANPAKFGIQDPPPPPPPPPPPNMMKWVVIGIAIILVITAFAILIIVATKKTKPLTRTGTGSLGGIGPGGSGLLPPPPTTDNEITIVRKGGAFVQNVDEKTMVPLPGWLEVLTGGKSIGDKLRLIGPQFAIMGRKSKESQGTNFIALEMDELPDSEKKTLSRKQAKIAYDEPNKEFTIENIGSFGTLVWVNGVELPSRQSMPLPEAAIIKMEPCWEFRFHKGR